MRKFFILSSILILFLSYGLLLSQYDFSAVEPSLSRRQPEGYYDYRGVTHSHSSLSIGSSSVEEIILSAQKAGLDFLIQTELNYFGQQPRVEGYLNGVLVLQADEYSYLDSHILVYPASSKHSFSGLGETQVFLSDLLSRTDTEKGGELIALAHPYKDNPIGNVLPLDGFNGIEVLNLKSVWQSAWNNSRTASLWSLFVYPFNSRLALLRIYDDPTLELALWDKLTASHPVVGLVGNDATAKLAFIGQEFFKFPSYEESFSIASNHILLNSELTGDFASDRTKILQALIRGNFYLCMDLLGDPKGFIALVHTKDLTYLPGSRVKLKTHPQLEVRLPQKLRFPFEVRLLKNGELLRTFNSTHFSLDLTLPGTYRIVVRVIPTLPLPDGKRWFSWIFSNPFYIE